MTDGRPLISRWADDHTTLNGWLHIPTPWSAELMAHQGYDSLTVDIQHGLMGFETAVAMLQVIGTAGVVPLARVPGHGPALIGRLLDLGAAGIIAPMINTARQCARFVAACRYHPAGDRSLGPTRAKLLDPAYAARANASILTIAMIETATAVANIDAITSISGLDAIYIGPGDLSLTLGSDQRLDNDDPLFLDAVDAILAACRRHNVVPGIHTNSVAYARRMIARGFRLITISTDSNMLANAASTTLRAIRDDQSPPKRADLY